MADALTIIPENRRSGAHPVLGYVGALVAGFAASVALTAPLSHSYAVWVWEWFAIAVFAACGLLMAGHDLRSKRLPDRLTLGLAAVLAGGVLAVAVTSDAGFQAVAAIAGGLGLAVILALIGLAGQMGFGDVKLALSVGILTGWHTWYLPAVALAVAFLLAFPFAAIAAVRRVRRAPIGNDMPFGPYLIAGGLAVAVVAPLAS
ncbi:prepilin peptidase [Micromonospora sp. DT81.3]|uniref:prepilin peptidase n=1 Tax=Micromonospora sp. DT81.3 TaxID=3416523 RepID=UPI003CF7BF94